MCSDEEQATTGEQFGFFDCDTTSAVAPSTATTPFDELSECLEHYQQDDCFHSSRTWCNTLIGMGFCLTPGFANVTKNSSFLDCQFAATTATAIVRFVVSITFDRPSNQARFYLCRAPTQRMKHPSYKREGNNSRYRIRHLPRLRFPRLVGALQHKLSRFTHRSQELQDTTASATRRRRNDVMIRRNSHVPKPVFCPPPKRVDVCSWSSLGCNLLRALRSGRTCWELAYRLLDPFNRLCHSILGYGAQNIKQWKQVATTAIVCTIQSYTTP